MRENKYIKGRLSADYTLFSENDERNRLSNSDLRILMLAATSLLCFGGFVGCALYRMPGLEKNTLYDSLLERYFTAMFSGCATPWDVLLVVTKCVFREILPLGVIFFGGFTVFTGFISGGMLLYRGLLFGFAFSMLEFTSKTGLLADAIFYLGGYFAVSTLMAIGAARAFAFYFPRRKPEIRSRETRDYLLVFLKLCALTAADVCLMLFLIYIYI